MCKDHFYSAVLPRLWSPATLPPQLLLRGAIIPAQPTSSRTISLCSSSRTISLYSSAPFTTEKRAKNGET
jgi:hypothetical protein